MIVQEQSGFVTGFGGQRLFLRWICPPSPRGGVLLMHGYSEHSGRYTHVIADLAARGFAVVAPDHRGHGRTARIRGDVEDMEWILADLGIAHRRLLHLCPAPTFALAHSMGGLLCLRYLQRYGNEFVGAVLNAPALRVPDHIPRTMRLVAQGIARVAPTLPLQPFFDPERNSRDPDVQQGAVEDPLVYDGWVRAGTGVAVMRLIRQTRADLSRIQIPLLITHGTADPQVPVEVSRQVLAAVSSTDVTLTLFDGLRHETHQEPERAEVVASWGDWIEAQASPA